MELERERRQIAESLLQHESKFQSFLCFLPAFLWNHTGQLPDIWHRASVWRTVSCNAFLNLQHVHFLFYGTLNIVDIGKFAHKIISVTFFSGTTEASFLIFGAEHQYGELYRITQFWICGMSTSYLTRLWIFKRKEVGRWHMSSLEDLLLSFKVFNCKVESFM